MSYLARLSARVAGLGTSARAVMPKGLNPLQRPAIVSRSTADTDGGEELRPPEKGGEEEDQLAAVRRQDAEEEEAPLASLRWQTEEERESIQALRRQEEDEESLQTLRRQEEDEEESRQALRRQEEEEKESLQTLRRQESQEEEEEVVEPMRPITRQEEVPLEDTGQTVPPPTQESLEPDAGPVSQELAGEEEPSDLQALHRDFPSMSVPSQSPAQAVPKTPLEDRPIPETVNSGSSFLSHQLHGMETPHTARLSHGAEFRRPQVIIDQVDVLIHEPASSADRGASQRSRDRAMRARYLRRL